jgi:hypothetical protein
MMRLMRLGMAGLLCLVGGVAAAAPIESLGWAERPPEVCSFTVDFGSACCGPDPATHERITRSVVTDPGVRRAYVWPWGREGESTLCLVTRSGADTRRIMAQFKLWAAASPHPALTQVWPGSRPHH